MSRIVPERLIRISYPYTALAVARYADIDVLGHVNNIAIAVLFEEARVSFLRSILGSEVLFRKGNRILTARTSIDYLREVAYPGEYQVGVAIGTVGRSSARLISALFDRDSCAAVSENVLVHVTDTGPGHWSCDDRTALSCSEWAFGAPR